MSVTVNLQTFYTANLSGNY